MENQVLIQKLRLKRGWSQQQLAEASGLSVRTIQRIESGMPASTETLKSIAAVFEVEFSTLTPEENMNTPEKTTEARKEEEAFRYVYKLRRFYIRVILFVPASLLLLGINFLTTPNRWWSVWVIGIWAGILLIRAAILFGNAKIFTPEWELSQVEKRLGRPL
jgi:transcriptional regulator with XRE-family HTH domain